MYEDGQEGDDAATEAFEKVRSTLERQGDEIALLRRAIEGLAAQRTEVPEQPDYSETLGRISNNRIHPAGAALAAASRPDTWNAMVAGAIIGQGNQTAFERCQRAATRAGEPVRCTVRIRPEGRR